MAAAAILKNPKHQISAAVQAIFMKFVVLTHCDLLDHSDRKNLKFQKIQDGGAGALTQMKISLLGGAFTIPRRNLGFLEPPHTSGSN